MAAERARPLTRLRLRSAPLVALAFPLAALATFGLPSALLFAAVRRSEDNSPEIMLGLAAVVGMAVFAQLTVFAAILWGLHGRKLVRHGRRWFVLAGFGGGFLAIASLAIPSLVQRDLAAFPTLLVLLLSGLLGAVPGALGGLVFALTATRRAPLEAVFA